MLDTIMLRWVIIFLMISIVVGAFGLFNLSESARRVSHVLFAQFRIGFLARSVLALLNADAVSAPVVAPPTPLAFARQ
jgi:uncharacterized membrane protein YtjA (UPF0391 family)